MSKAPTFELASRRIVACIALMDSVVQYGKAGLIDDAYRVLQTMQNQYNECAPTLEQLIDTLASQSDEQVRPLNINGCPHCWSSAHEAALGIVRLALDALYYPVVSDWEVDSDPNSDQPFVVKQVTDPSEQRRRAEAQIGRASGFDFDREWVVSLQERIRRERAKLAGSQQRRKRTKPRKDEKGSNTKVLAALCKHHEYDDDGESIGNYEPATGRALSAEFGVSSAALSRFLKNKLGENGGKRYRQLCASEQIGAMLTLWNGDMPAHFRKLRSDDDGKGYKRRTPPRQDD